jgi:hypothetical protein
MSGLDHDFQIFAVFGRRVAFARLKNFNIAALHLLAAQFHCAER